MSGVLGPVLDNTVKERWSYWRLPFKWKVWSISPVSKRLTELGLFSLEKRRFWGRSPNVFKCLEGFCKADRARLLSVLLSDRRRDSGPKVKHRRLHLNVRNHFFTVRVMEHWHRLPRDVVESLYLEVFKSSLKVVLGNGLQVPMFEHRGCTRWPPEVFFQPKLLYDHVDELICLLWGISLQ